MMNLNERIRQAMQKDVAEMNRIYQAAAKGKSAAEACSQVVGGHFKLSETVVVGIKKGALV